jgi:hypothetical protein
MSTNMAQNLSSMNGASFIGLDTETTEPLLGGKSNPMQGRITKRSTGHSVMVFQNKNGSSYVSMVQRRLVAEGKAAGDYEPQDRKWGVRLPNTPIVRNIDEKTGERKYYLEVIFLKAGTSEYFLDGAPIDKADIIGLKTAKPSGQGGLENQVQIRTFAMDSLTAVRCDKQEFKAPFHYDADMVIGSLVRSK